MPDSAVTTDEFRKALDWLYEQRQIDQDRILQISRFVEAMADQLTEHAALHAEPEDASSSPDQADGRPTNQLQDLIEQIARIDRVLDEHVSTQARVTQIESAQRERDRRQLAEIAQQVETTSRTVDAFVGRVNALVEEVRRERDARTPLGYGLEEVQRSVAALNSRVMANDEQGRRMVGNQSVIEGGLDKHRSELTRLDNAVKILELRFSRDLTDIRQAVADWQEQATEEIKPIGGITKQLVILAEQRDAIESRLSKINSDIDAQRDELGRLDAVIRSDRTAFNRISEAAETQTRRAEQSEAIAWQLSERVEALADQLERLDRETQSVDQLVEEAAKRIGGVDAERGQLAERLRELAEATREQFLASQTRMDTIEQHLSNTIQAMSDNARLQEQVSLDHLRRMIGELSRQLMELEGMASDSPQEH